MKADLRSMTPEELQKEMESIGEAKFRAKQIFRWLHVKYAENFEEMTDLSENLRNKLNDNYIIGGVKIVRKLVSKEDNTTKYLFELYNRERIYAVFLWQYGLYFNSGRLQDGMYFLCFYVGRSGKKSYSG